MNELLNDKLKQIQLLLLDVDGVLTHGDMIYDKNGDAIKMFNAKDGLGIRLLLEAGICVGIVTGRRSKALHHRCKELGIEIIFDNILQKDTILGIVCEQTRVSPSETAFIGDDLPDIPLMRHVGLSVAVADANEVCKRSADMITAAQGGKGAVREVCEAILKAKNIWDSIIETYGAKPIDDRKIKKN